LIWASTNKKVVVAWVVLGYVTSETGVLVLAEGGGGGVSTGRRGSGGKGGYMESLPSKEDAV
jgi:hypothetical protein